MTDDNSNMRPNLEEVAGKIVKYFNSESEAIDEMDRIVEYVLGTSLEVCPITFDIEFIYRYYYITIAFLRVWRRSN